MPAKTNAAKTAPSSKKEQAPAVVEQHVEVPEAAPAKAKAAPAKKQQNTPATPKTKTAPAKAPAKTKTAPAKAAPVQNTEEEENEEKGTGIRYFKILAKKIQPLNGSPEIAADDLSLKGGRFKGRNPMQAAKKAFTGLCNIAAKSGFQGDCFYVFTIQETSQGSSKKEFTYQGERHRLETPQAVVKDGTTYYVKFSSNVKSHKQTSSSESSGESSSSSADEKPVSKTKPRTKKNVQIQTPAEAESSSPAVEEPAAPEAPVATSPAAATPVAPQAKQPPKGGARSRGNK